MLPCSLPDLRGARERQAAAGAFAGLQIARLTVPQFPEDGGRVYCPVARRPWVRVLHPEPGECSVLMLQECGKLWVQQAAASRLELSEFVAFDSIAS